MNQLIKEPHVTQNFALSTWPVSGILSFKYIIKWITQFSWYASFVVHCRLSTGALSRLILSDDSLRMSVNDLRTSKVNLKAFYWYINKKIIKWMKESKLRKGVVLGSKIVALWQNFPLERYFFLTSPSIVYLFHFCNHLVKRSFTSLSNTSNYIEDVFVLIL